MVDYIPLRAEQTFFFATPQANTNRASRLYVQRLQDANSLHHHNAARAVVGCAGARMPRIQMGSQHHYFVFFVGAGNFGERVVLGHRVVVEIVLDIQFQLHVFLLLQQPGNAGPVLGGHGELGHVSAFAHFVGAA